MTIDVDATLITAHSEKEKAAGNYKGGYGFHPLQVYLDETREVARRPAATGERRLEHRRRPFAVLDLALAQIPAEYIETPGDPGARGFRRRHARLVDYCREGNMRFSVGYELTEQVRAAILADPRGCLGRRRLTRTDRAATTAKSVRSPT